MSLGRIRFNKIFGVFPNLARDERLELVQQPEQNAQANIDFIMMIILIPESCTKLSANARTFCEALKIIGWKE